MKTFFYRIFPLIFILLGASIAFLGVRGLVRAKASMGWPSTQGSIVESSVERQQNSGSEGGSTTYHAEILYEFTVDGTIFNGDRVAYGDYGSSNPSHARRVVNRYPKGKTVTVYFMPDNPEECLLEPGIKGQAFVLPSFGLIFFTVGALTIFFFPKKTRNQEITDQKLGSKCENGGEEGKVS